MTLLIDHPLDSLSERTACVILSLCRSTVRTERRRRIFCGPPAPRKTSRKGSYQSRALSEQEREVVLETLNRETFCEQPPMQVYYRLLEEGTYLCSMSTMHRLLREKAQNGERRLQRPKQHNAVPRLRATKPNEVWTWDITKLPTEKRGEYLSLYVVIDLYSRYIVAWMLSTKENSALSQQLIQEASTRYGIERDQLTLHQDRGTPMTAHCYLDLLGELAITASHSRPRVSNDNPHSESLFKTAKYQPDFPRRFANYSHAKQWCDGFVDWYNFSHHHSSLAGYTPCQVFTQAHETLHEQRQQVLDKQFDQHPNRFVKGRPKVAIPPAVVEINPVTDDQGDSVITDTVNFATLARAKVT
jgi:putative transposase